MKNCYVLGATGGMENAEETFGVYKEVLGEAVNVLGTPIETLRFKGTDKARFKRAEAMISDSDLIVADLSAASTGAGIEIGMAYLLGKKIVVFAKNGSKVSALIHGMVAFEDMYSYADVGELARVLGECLKSLDIEDVRDI